MPPKSSYADRVFTTEVVAFPGAVHIDEKKDFTPVIKKALELGGYKENQTLKGINGGTKVTTGFGHSAILSHANTIVDAVKSGAISHSSWLPDVMVLNRVETITQILLNKLLLTVSSSPWHVANSVSMILILEKSMVCHD